MGAMDVNGRWLRELGPQWAAVGGKLYLCHTSVVNAPGWYIATTPQDYRLYRINPTTAVVKIIEMTNSPLGEVMPPDRHFTIPQLVQIVAEAWLRNQHGVQDVTHYLVTVLVCTRLMLADQLTTDLIPLLQANMIPGMGGELETYKDDTLDSPRLRILWVQAVSQLALDAIARCPE